ncbi:hypothetical protein GCM10020001_029100 [Nonomuraea salmonea]
MKILPEFGDLGDFVRLVDEAHKRGMRVIADLVMNHTSDAHPWFQASRHDPEGPYGDFYVWSDTDEKYQDARIIFIDTETSNWTYDPVRGQYYWHRFFHHQPDLNYDNPDVQKAMLEVLRFWLDLGIDGFRLDAVPYLFEEEGTNCENLPKTHQYLKQVRAEVDRIYPDRVLLAEANQWPSDVVEYFGDPVGGGDECHMAFHFPLMPRIFMAVRRESRFPISEILAQTPKNSGKLPMGDLPPQPRRAHPRNGHGRRTRLHVHRVRQRPPACGRTSASAAAWPLCWRTTATRSSCSPRCCCRCPAPPCSTTATRSAWATTSGSATATACAPPMQWDPDRNAGFSDCDPGRLYLPVIMDPIYGYQAINVEAQQKNAGSLLHWTRRMIEIRKRHPVFGLGGYAELNSSNPSVLAFVRELGDDRMLCVNNLSRFPQPVELDLRRFVGVSPVETMGGVPFPAIGELPYLLTLPGHGFYWFTLPPAVTQEE